MRSRASAASFERREAGARSRHERRGHSGAAATGACGRCLRLSRVGRARTRTRRRARRLAAASTRIGPEVEGVDTRRCARRRRAGARAIRTAAGSSPPRRASSCSPTGSRSCRRIVASSADEAIAAAATLGYPVVVKTAAAGAHKTETGGIALDLLDDEAVRAAVERIGAPVIVQPMVSGGTELLAGLVQDPVFGPLVAFGPGGVLAELIGQASFRIAPLTDVDAEELVSEGKAGVLVRGFRGAPAADAAALVDLVQQARAARTRPSRRRGARSQPGPRASRAVCRRRRSRSRRALRCPPADEELVGLDVA